MAYMVVKSPAVMEEGVRITTTGSLPVREQGLGAIKVKRA